jgi:hypothetical protein
VGIASFNLAAPVFGLIGLGGLAIGCAPVAGAVFGRRTVLSVSPTGATLLLEENLLTRAAGFGDRDRHGLGHRGRVERRADWPAGG